jgi:hypothetical protein
MLYLSNGVVLVRRKLGDSYNHYNVVCENREALTETEGLKDPINDVGITRGSFQRLFFAVISYYCPAKSC